MELFGSIFLPDEFRETVSGEAWIRAMLEAEGALTEAVKARSPMLMLAGDTASTTIYHNLDVDQDAVAESPVEVHYA